MLLRRDGTVKPVQKKAVSSHAHSILPKHIFTIDDRAQYTHQFKEFGALAGDALETRNQLSGSPLQKQVVG